MTLILKSNQAVIDPTNQFHYITNQGEATKRVHDFKKAIEEGGGTLTQAEFDALNTLDKGISDLGVWNNILEFSPVVGSNLSAKLLKFKAWKTPSLTVKNSFDATNVNDKALIWNTAQGSGAKGLGLGFTIQDIFNLPNGFGSIKYFKYNNTTNANAQSYIFGAGDANSDDANALSNYIMTGNGQHMVRRLNATQGTTPATLDFRASAHLVSTSTRWDGSKNINNRVTFDGQTKLLDSTSVVALVNGTKPNQEIYLGAKNATSGALMNFYGQIGISLFHDGVMDNTKILAVSKLIEDFIAATGKTL